LRILSPAIIVALIALLAAGCAQGPTSSPSSTSAAAVNSIPAQPYAGLQARPIRSLAPEKMEDLLAGRGTGYALAAELNHYPGPTHVLQLANELSLTQDQERIIQDIFATMQKDAQALGRELVDLEAELDQAFRRSSVTGPSLKNLTAEIARVEGQLRSVHLAAHVELKEVLSPEQVNRYDQLRGYVGMGSESDTGHNHGHTAH
jgi:Spy/CpxP family protein refolding chaperone